MQLAEYRQSPQAGMVGHLSTSTHSTRFGVRRGMINHHSDICANSTLQRNQLSIRISSALLANPALRMHLPCTSASAPAVTTFYHEGMDVLGATYSSAPLPSDAGVLSSSGATVDDSVGRELKREAASRANRSGAGALYRRRQELLG